MDDRRFDQLSRRVADLRLPLPRRGLLTLLGGGALAGALGLAAAGPQDAAAKSCKKEGKKCDKKKCKKQDKKCCCNNLKCKNSVCESKGGNCPTSADFDLEWGGNGSGDGKFIDPWGIATDPDGDVYITDTGNQRVQIFDQNGNFQDEWGSDGTGQEQFELPLGIGVNENNNGQFRVIVSDPGQTSSSRKLRRFQVNGSFLTDIGRSALAEPYGVAIDADNNIWVVDNVSDGEIFLYDDAGDFVTSWIPDGNGALDNPQGIAVYEDKDDDATYVYVTDTGNNRVVKFEYVNNNTNGLDFIEAAELPGSGSQNFNTPIGVAVDKCGNLWVADNLNNRIQQLDKDLNFESRFSNSLNRPTGVALSPNGNSLYVVNNVSDDVEKFSLS